MKRVCAWCKADMGEAEVKGNGAHPVTHGICAPCAQQFLGEVSGPMRDFLDRLGVPVLVVDDGAVVRAANVHAEVILGQDFPDIVDRRQGEVVRCVHAYEPGGCGEQADCSGCTIRRAVLETHATGIGCTSIRAFPSVLSGGESRKLNFEFSTEKIGNTVLLRIHEYEDAAS